MKPAWRFAVLGRPIQHSRSPALHRAAGQICGLSVFSEAISLGPEELKEALPRLRKLDGFNVTAPLKEQILPFMDEIGPEAERLGAVNTVRCKEGVLYGENSDLEGFLRALPKQPFLKPVILGAGGAARAVVVALMSRSIPLKILNRNIKRAQYLLETLEVQAEVFSLERGLTALRNADLLINCLPPSAGLPIPLELLPVDCLLMDLSYSGSPLQTRGFQLGLEILDGWEMFLAQGARSFEIWTTRRPGLEELRAQLFSDSQPDSSGK